MLNIFYDETLLVVFLTIKSSVSCVNEILISICNVEYISKTVMCELQKEIKMIRNTPSEPVELQISQQRFSIGQFSKLGEMRRPQ
jgi:hypothetical protein